MTDRAALRASMAEADELRRRAARIKGRMAREAREERLRSDPEHMRRCHHAERMRRCAGCSWAEVARALEVSEREARDMVARALGKTNERG